MKYDIVIAMITKDGCMPCRQQRKEFNKQKEYFQRKYPTMVLRIIPYDPYRDFLAQYHIKGCPTLLFFVKNQLKASRCGVQLQSEIDTLLSHLSTAAEIPINIP